MKAKVASWQWRIEYEGKTAIADITAMVAVDFARRGGMRPGEQHVHLRRWREAMGRRPSMAN